jgi:hypothetical protein
MGGTEMLINMSLKLYRYFQAQYLTFRKKLVTKFLMLYSNYGGVMMMTTRGCIGMLGEIFAF